MVAVLFAYIYIYIPTFNVFEIQPPGHIDTNIPRTSVTSLYIKLKYKSLLK